MPEADEAIYVRRNFAVEQERKIKENELQTQIAIEVNCENSPAIELYKKKGFKNYAVRKRYYPDGKDAILMKREFHWDGMVGSGVGMFCGFRNPEMAGELRIFSCFGRKGFLPAPFCPCRSCQVRMLFTISPWTSVRRNCRPWKRKVNLS